MWLKEQFEFETPVLDTAESYWKLVSKMCESTISMMKQSKLKTESEWEAKHCTIMSEKPRP